MYNLESLILLVLLVIQVCYAAVYTDLWAAHIEGGENFAKSLAHEYGFTYLGKVMPEIYHLKHRHVVKRSAFPSPHHHASLIQHPQVHWVEQQIAKKRVKRDNSYNDPKWPRMWYLNRAGGLDMNVQEAWRLNITGKNVVVSILDDGIEKDHPDLKTNYDPDASTDVNGHDPDPQPRYDYSNENRHGTRCAGEVAAEANNGICSVGVAYEAKIGGVRMLDGDVTDSVEAKSLSHNPDHIDIYSASWGPDDDGRTVDGPASLARKAFQNGIHKGRNGLGSIFVWASGNGGREFDSCNCDGYTNSIYTLSISGATETGKVPWYSEACSSTLATTYSSGSGGERQIVTTDLRKSCTEGHTGTSASAPLAAGICALALHANPGLTWRDLQHIVVMTARTANLRADDWVVNGVGRNVSHSFGYGLMDAGAMVKLAKNWTNVPKQHVCQIYSTEAAKGIPVHGRISVRLQSDGCRGSNGNEVLFLEHVQAIVTLASTRRGQLEIYLRSPKGTRSTLLAQRARDTSTEGFNNWAFMTIHNWGEFSTGTWTLEVVNGASTATLHNWSLVLYGTERATHSSKLPADRIPQIEGCSNPETPYFLEGGCFAKCPSSFFVTNKTVIVPSASLSSNQSENEKSIASTIASLLTTRETSMNVSMSELGNSSSDTKEDHNGTSVEIMYQTCVQCWGKCSNCTGPSFADCTSCFEGYEMTNDSCVAHSFYQDHLMITVPFLFSIMAILVFLMVFIVLHMCSNRNKPRGYMAASTMEEDGHNTQLVNGGSGGGGGGVGIKNGMLQKSELERRSLLEDSESDLENEVFGYDKKPPNPAYI